MKKSLLAVIAFALLAAASFASAVDFGMPFERTVAFSTPYQATNSTSAAVIAVVTRCEWECTQDVRVGSSSALDCTNGTVVFDWFGTSANARGMIDINLPAGAWFIICPTSGNVLPPAAVEQSIS